MTLAKALAPSQSSPPPPLPLGTKFVGYELRGLIGRGGHACVYHGYDSFLGQHVAIKVLHRPGGVTKAMLQRGQAEAQLLHRLRHPNIVEVMRAGIEDGLLFIIMELLRGQSLRRVLQQHGRLAIEEVLFLTAQIADAAAAAHDHKAIHRDLKPDNVFVTRDNHVKVLDFGIAKLMHHAAWTTQQNVVLGTLLYMSPEQIQGLPLTPHSDIYALGLIMYEALTGCHPCLTGGQPATVAELTRIQVMRHPPALDEILPGTPSYVARLVGRAIAKRPEERQASMRELAADIRRNLERYVAEARPRYKILQTRDLSRSVAPGQPLDDPDLNSPTHTLTAPTVYGDLKGAPGAEAAAIDGVQARSAPSAPPSVQRRGPRVHEASAQPGLSQTEALMQGLRGGPASALRAVWGMRSVRISTMLGGSLGVLIVFAASSWPSQESRQRALRAARPEAAVSADAPRAQALPEPAASAAALRANVPNTAPPSSLTISEPAAPLASAAPREPSEPAAELPPNPVPAAAPRPRPANPKPVPQRRPKSIFDEPLVPPKELESDSPAEQSHQPWDSLAQDPEREAPAAQPSPKTSPKPARPPKLIFE